MNREDALDLLKQHLKTENLLKHTYAVEAVMRELAERLGEDADRWGLAGLLHDIDYDQTGDDPSLHSIKGADMLAEAGFDAELVDAVRAHNDHHGLPRESSMAKALYAVDPLTGLIVAAALVHPEKKLAALDVEFVLNRFDDNSFARGANRDAITSCEEELGLSLEEFVDLAIGAMVRVSDELGL